MMLVMISVVSMSINKPVYAASVHYGDYGCVGGIVCYATRVKYTTKSCTTVVKRGKNESWCGKKYQF